MDEPEVGIFPACMVERGPEHERSAATHDGWGTGTLRSGHVYYYPVAQPTAVQFSAPVADVVRPSTTHANAAGSLLPAVCSSLPPSWRSTRGTSRLALICTRTVHSRLAMS